MTGRMTDLVARERIEHNAFMIGANDDDMETLDLLSVCDGYAGAWLEAVGRLIYDPDLVVSSGDAEIEEARTLMIGSIYRAFVQAGWDGESVAPVDDQFVVDGSGMVECDTDDERRAMMLASEFVDNLAAATGFEEGDLFELPEQLAVRASIAFGVDDGAAMRP